MKAWQIVSEVLLAMAKMAENGGVTPIEIDDMAEEMIISLGGESINKNYKPQWAKRPYPRVSCIGLNWSVVHNIPDATPIIDGDIVTFDLGIRDKEGNCGDAALTIPIGRVENKTAKLLHYSRKILLETIKQVKAGVNTREIAEFIQTFARDNHYTLIRSFGGHTIGREMHEKPTIYNTVEKKHEYATLKEGQQICIEIMLTTGKDDMGVVLPDGWSVITKDGENCAYFEHQMEVTKTGAKVLTNHIDENISYY